MTKQAQIALARIQIAEEAEARIAFYKGQIARAKNRPRDGVLVPKEYRETPNLLAEFQKGWDAAEAEVAKTAE